MNRQELYEIIDSVGRKNSREFVRRACGQYPEIYDDDEVVQKLERLGYTVNSVDGYGGEGQGEDYWGIFSLEKDGVETYWMLSGWYASFNGAEVELDSLEEVKPKEVTVRKWVKK
jgi:hypothetical protein